MVLDMKKTQLKVSRRWNTMKNGIRLPSGKPMPLYGTAWSIKTIAESNDQGSWYNYKVDRVTEITKELEAMMLEARLCIKVLEKGRLKWLRLLPMKCHQIKQKTKYRFNN